MAHLKKIVIKREKLKSIKRSGKARAKEIGQPQFNKVSKSFSSFIAPGTARVEV